MTQIDKNALVNPALIQENRRLKAELEAVKKDNAMLREQVKHYHAKALRDYSRKNKRSRDIADFALDVLIAGRWGFAAVAFMVVSWHVWMAVWGINI